MEILVKYLLKHRDIVDSVQLWENTLNKSDIDWIRSLKSDYFIPLRIPDRDKFGNQLHFHRHPVQYNTGRFYVYTKDPDTLYIRFDDDIVYVHDDYFKNILDFRIDNPDYFLVFGNIWNNAIISYIEQKMGNIDLKYGVVDRVDCMHPVGWGSPDFGVHIHRILLEHIKNNTESNLFFDRFELERARFSISNFCFFGKDFAAFDGHINELDEEIWLTQSHPNKHNLSNVICGRALVSHYTFFTQKAAIEATDILEQYRKISDEKLSKDYYRLLALEEK